MNTAIIITAIICGTVLGLVAIAAAFLINVYKLVNKKEK